MLTIVFSIAVLNLCIGFMLAVHLGYGPPSLSAAWRAFNGVGSSARFTAEHHSQGCRSMTSVCVDEAKDADTNDADTNSLDFDDEELGSLLDMDEDDAFFDDLMDDGPGSDESDDDDAHDGNSRDAEEDSIEATSDSGVPENWLLDDKHIETSVLKLNIAMMKSGARAAELDSRLRACRGKADPEKLKAIMDLLRADCESYLSEQAEAADKLSQRLEEFGDLASMTEEIEMGNMQQAAQIETTLSNLAQLDFDGDAEAAAQRLLEELGKLREARHQLRDGQEVAFFTIALHENRVDNIPKQLFNDELTGLRSRAGLESTLHDWWSVAKHEKHQMSAALFDVDGFTSVNSRHGPEIAERILKQIAAIMNERCATGDLLGRFAGQRFLFVTLDKGPRTAVKDAEYLSQSVRRATFECGGEQFNVSMCGGYTEITQGDNLEAVKARLETALAAAKASGPGRGCFHDGRETEIVESPNLGAEYREVKLDEQSIFPVKQ